MNDKHNGTDRPLRLVTLLDFIPGFAMLLAYGIVANDVVLGLGILPLAFSAATGLVHLCGKAKSRIGNVFMDVFCACFLFSLLVPSFVVAAQPTRGDYWRSHVGNGTTMMAAYGTVPMMMNMVLHVYWALREIGLFRMFILATCPYCRANLHGDLRCSAGNGTYQQVNDGETSSGHSKESFVSAHDEEAGPSMSQAPRPSTDDESARLL